MPYIKRTTTAGKTKEIEKSYSSRYGRKGIGRSKNMNPTPDDVKRVNQRNAETRLRRLINCNFEKNDIHLVLTYKKDERPKPEEAKKILANFIRRIKRRYKKLGIEFKYIHVTEFGKKNGAIHHHILLPGIDTREIQELWPFGKARPTYFDDKGDYGQLANYLIKETSKAFMKDGTKGRRYHPSRGMKQPKTDVEIVFSNTYRENPKPEKGYYIELDSIKNGVHEVTGNPYQFYRMIKLERGTR